MTVGDRVRLTRVPPAVEDRDGFPTRTILETCIGRVFPVVGFQHVDGLPDDLVELEVGEAVGREPWATTIWVEPDCLELIETSI